MFAIPIPRVSSRDGSGPAHDPADNFFAGFAAAGDRYATNRAGDKASRQTGRSRSIRHKRKLVRDQFACREKRRRVRRTIRCEPCERRLEAVTVGGPRDNRRSGKCAKSAYRAYRSFASVIHASIVAP